MSTKTPDTFYCRFTRAYDTMKGRYPDTVLLLRGGDFYEAFDDDAETISRVAGIRIDKSHPVRLGCGVPYHAIHRTVETLVAAGHRVAVEEFTEPTSPA